MAGNNGEVVVVLVVMMGSSCPSVRQVIDYDTLTHSFVTLRFVRRVLLIHPSNEETYFGRQSPLPTEPTPPRNGRQRQRRGAKNLDATVGERRNDQDYPRADANRASPLLLLGSPPGIRVTARAKRRSSTVLEDEPGERVESYPLS